MSHDPTATAASTDDLSRQVRRGISWNVVGTLTTNAMRIVVVVALGRLLDARDFGLVAAAMAVVGILHQLLDVGIGPALIQRAELEAGHTRTAFAMSAWLGTGLAAALALGGPWIARAYDMPDLVGLLAVIGLIFPLRGVATTSRVLCQRAMNFRAVTLTNATAYVTGASCSVVLAVLGLGPWSLIVGYLVEEAINTAVFLYLRPVHPTLRIDRRCLRDLLGFGAGNTLIQLANILAIYGDNFVVGARLGPSALGFYARAYDIIKMPALLYGNVVGNVLFAAFSRLQRDPLRIKTTFRRVIFANALVLLPASATLVVLAPEVIRLLMGPGWEATVLPFQILAATMLMRVSYKVGATVAIAAGAVYQLAVANVAYAVTVIGGAALTVRWGIAGVAASTAASFAVIYLLCTWLGIRRCALRWGEFAYAHLHGTALAGLVVAASWPLARSLRAAGLPTAATLAIVSIAGVAICVALAALWVRGGRGDFGWLRSELGRLVSRRRRPAA